MCTFHYIQINFNMKGVIKISFDRAKNISLSKEILGRKIKTINEVLKNNQHLN